MTDLLPVLLGSFGLSGVLCAAGLAAAYLADSGGLLLPRRAPARRPVAVPLPAATPARDLFPLAAAAISAALAPVYCPASRRWRDPVTRRFVAAPAA